MKLQKHYPVKLLCALLGLPRSSHYYQAVARDEASLKQAVETIVAQYPTYGVRRVQHQWRRDYAAFRSIGRKRVRRVLRDLGLALPRKSAKQRTTNSQHAYPRYPNLVKELTIVRPEQVWVADITYIKLGDGSFVYLAILMDVYTRIIRGWALSRSLGAALTLLALQRALAAGVPEIHHSDQGVQ
jgi:transposase InsO family protein